MELDPTAAAAPSTVGQTPPAALPEQPGRFGPYELLESFAGGMGVVFRARHAVLDRVVALKLVQPGRTLTDSDRVRFAHEARAVAQLRHPHVVEIIDFGEVEGQPYLTMEFVEGGSLSRRLGEFVGQPRRAVELVEKVARAVQHAHEKRILHRDLKPGNILVRGNGEPVVADFGLAKMLDADESITASGALLGTPAYMAPEQFLGRGELVSTTTDVWALGVVLHELLTGKRPFPGSSRDELTTPVLMAEPTAPSSVRADVPRSLDAVVLRCLCREPSQRYASAEALADDLARWLDGQRPKTKKPLTAAARRRRRWLMAGGLLLVVLVAGPLIWLATLDGEPKLREELEITGEIMLIGATGPPRSFRLVTDNIEMISTGMSQEFSFKSEGIGLLELMSTTGQDRFQFRAELASDEPASVGLYVGREGFATKRGQWNCFIVAMFGPIKQQPNGPVQPGIQVSMAYCKGAKPTGRDGKSLFNEKSDLPAADWRTVEFVVEPETIGVNLSGLRDKKSFRRLDMMIEARNFAAGKEILLAGVTPTYPPRGGIGIFVSSGAARVRNATVKRLDP